MKIMVTGHSGMLGKEVVKAVERMGHEAVINKTFDITKDKKLGVHAKVVINCAGLVPQKEPTPWPYKFMQVNAAGPWLLADLCDRIGARLIQVSTDCVFDRAQNLIDQRPHLESDPPQPVTPYGYSKLAGEICRAPHLTVRTSFVGFGERGLIAELLQCAEKNELYRASDDLLWTGHTTPFIAEVLVMLAEREINGLLHIPGETLTRYELVVKLKSWLDMDNLQYARAITPKIDRRLGSERWARERLPDLPSFEWQLEWLRRSQ